MISVLLDLYPSRRYFLHLEGFRKAEMSRKVKASSSRDEDKHLCDERAVEA